MNSIWVYGCSFSEPFGICTNSGINLDGTRFFEGAQYWGNYLSYKLNMNLKTRSLAGIGWNYINNVIDEDILKWDKDDIVIISPSYWSRITIVEFNQPHKFEEFAGQLKDMDWVCKYTEKRWANKIQTLQNFGYNVYTWVIDKPTISNKVHNLIPLTDTIIDLDTYMQQNKEFWLGTTHSHLPQFKKTDWHFNDSGHLALSEIFYNYIK
jgi:hypothetical protein